MNPLLIVVAILIVIAICLPLAWYNKLVRLRQLIRESWGNVDVQLKRRYDLIPNLVKHCQRLRRSRTGNISSGNRCPK